MGSASIFGAQLPGIISWVSLVQIAENSYLSAPHHAELIERQWGSSTHITIEEVKKKIADLLQQYIRNGDTTEACRCIKEWAVPLFHHEVVKRALTLGMESLAAAALIVIHLKEASKQCLVGFSQMMKGFYRMNESLDDLILDILSSKSAESKPTVKNDAAPPTLHTSFHEGTEET